MIASLIGGGAMGAIIAIFAARHRNKRQPVGYRKEVIEVFKKNPEFPSLQAVLMVGDPSDSGGGFVVHNLSVVRYALVNKGNHDLQEFKFGLTLGGTNSAVDVKTETPDRHHTMDVLTPVSISNRKTELDFSLNPFNRAEEYRLNVYFTYADEPGSIELSSPHSTEFSEINTLTTIRQAELITNTMRHASLVGLIIVLMFLTLKATSMSVLPEFLKELFIKK
jgi:hypothetical protein